MVQDKARLCRCAYQRQAQKPSKRKPKGASPTPATPERNKHNATSGTNKKSRKMTLTTGYTGLLHPGLSFDARRAGYSHILQCVSPAVKSVYYFVLVRVVPFQTTNILFPPSDVVTPATVYSHSQESTLVVSSLGGAAGKPLNLLEEVQFTRWNTICRRCRDAFV